MKGRDVNQELPKILIVDDIASNIDYLVGLLSDYDVSAALDGESALESLEEEKPDLILLDIAMPGLDGYETCTIIKSNPETKDIPILFLSAKTDTESIVKAFDTGGVDYITKPYSPREVLARVQTQLKLKYAMQSLEKMAREDSMTGISNRRRFFEEAKVMFSKVKENYFSLFLFIVDIDRFKDINDTHGHDIGDEVIKKFADIFNSHLKYGDCFARLGGDEFTIMMSHLTKEEALIRADEIRKAVDQTHNLSGVEVNFTISMGMAQVEHNDEDIDSVIKRADMNLYKAKRSTRNQIRS